MGAMASPINRRPRGEPGTRASPPWRRKIIPGSQADRWRYQPPLAVAGRAWAMPARERRVGSGWLPTLAPCSDC
jgi:hypothetical protein